MLDKFINKVGIDRIAHFGVGGTVGGALALMFIYSLPYSDGELALNWWNAQVPFILSYVAVAILAWFKEMNDATPDKWDFVASVLGVVAVHLCSNIGWLLHLCNGHDLITSAWGWVVFGIVMLTLAVLWVRWYLRFRKR